MLFISLITYPSLLKSLEISCSKINKKFTISNFLKIFVFDKQSSCKINYTDQLIHTFFLYLD